MTVTPVVPGSAAHAAGAPGGRFGIRLLEAPVSRRNDPRALLYIVDHVKPGTVISRRLELSNTSNLVPRASVYPGAASIHDGSFAFAPGRTPDELSGWISLDRPSVVLPAHGTTQVRATIKVPRQASPGERYAVIWAEVAAPKDASHNVRVVHRIGVRVYLDVGPGGEPAPDFRIESLTPTRTKDGRAQVTAQVRNTGGRALDMNGVMTLSGGPGSLRAGPFRATPGTTLAPGQAGAVPITLNDPVPAGPWTAHVTLGSGKLKHSAEARITFPAAGVGRPTRPRTHDVALLLSAGGAFLALGALILFGRRRRRVRAM